MTDFVKREIETQGNVEGQNSEYKNGRIREYTPKH